MRSISAGLLSGIHRVSYTYIIKQYFFAMSRKFFAADTMPAAKRRFYTHFWQVCITLIAFWSLSPIPLFCTRSSKKLLCFQCVESVKPEAVLSLYGRCTQRSLSYYITHPAHFPACVSQRDRMPRLVHQHNFIFPSEGVEGPPISKPRHCLMEIGSGLVTDFTQALRKQPMEYANCFLIILKRL